MSDVESRVVAFFASYRAAFERGGAARILSHYSFPLHLTNDVGERVDRSLVGATEMLALIQRLFAMYRAIDVRSSIPLVLHVTPLSPDLVLANLQWELRNSAGVKRYTSRAAYTLVNLDGAFRICAIALYEEPEYHKCVALLSGSEAGG